MGATATGRPGWQQCDTTQPLAKEDQPAAGAHPPKTGGDDGRDCADGDSGPQVGLLGHLVSFGRSDLDVRTDLGVAGLGAKAGIGHEVAAALDIQANAGDCGHGDLAATAEFGVAGLGAEAGIGQEVAAALGLQANLGDLGLLDFDTLTC
jgi:hypothetical protein